MHSHCSPPLHHSRRRLHSCASPGSGQRARQALGAPEEEGNLLQAQPVPDAVNKDDKSGQDKQRFLG